MKKNYGVFRYTKEQRAFHEDIVKVLHKKEHRKIPADECMVVFGRIYSMYVMGELKLEKRLKIIKKR